MIDKVSVLECALCGACLNACPTNAISFNKAYRDFSYPQINEILCVRCNSCEKVCPVLRLQKRPESGRPVAFAAKSNDDSVRLRSTSGGAFYELAMQMLRDGGYICGAVFDKEFHVRHIVTDTQEDLFRMMGSKYTQSNVEYCYREIREKLENGNAVLFSGCPCQVAGLRSFLGRDYSNLLLVELICHGIPGDRMLQAYIGMQEKKYGAKLKSLEFRNKSKGWHNSSVCLQFENRRVYTKPITADAYMRGFLGGFSLKSACYNCHFRNFTSGSDIILGDFWGAEVELPDDDNKGISAILVNTEKGMLMLDNCRLERSSVEIETVIKYNKSLVKSAVPNLQKEQFYACAEQDGLEAAIKTYLEESTLQRFKRRGRYILRRVWYAMRGKNKPIY